MLIMREAKEGPQEYYFISNEHDLILIFFSYPNDISI